MTADVYTILRALAEGGHLAVNYPPTRAAKCKLFGPWKDHTPGPNWPVSMSQMQRLDATGILTDPTRRAFSDGTVTLYYHLKEGKR